jgi:hypothetical protein
MNVQQYQAWETGPPAMQTYRELALELSPTRLLTCSDADRAQVARVVGRPVSAAQVRDAVQAAATQGAAEGRAVARALRPPRSAQTVQTFASVFNVPPTFVPNWRPATGVRWRDLGELVAIRLEAAASILVGGHMRFYCWGSAAHCSECPGPPTYRACSSYRGSYRICLGQPWWEWWRDGQRGFMASTLLHEALHIYFRLEHHKATIGRPSVSNMYCYDTLVALMSGRAPKPGDRERCAHGRTP